ncbi:hypothetical protein [Tsukamurella paurometabola]|uniref:Uncharacterized protein n=1 Tax=Tsukamurella paurometabola TaxID=2061 RepID=A0ABS5NI43_TSUPA|nr:hypothetical protein [Tsukamurella paurometabola]MBS4103964.1 hypothetical protein [Tsukamurella paurometabola]
MDLDVVKPDEVVAYGNPRRVEIVRSVAVKGSCPFYQEALFYALDNGLVRITTENFPAGTMFALGEVTVDVWVTPEERDGILAGELPYTQPWYVLMLAGMQLADAIYTVWPEAQR